MKSILKKIYRLPRIFYRVKVRLESRACGDRLKVNALSAVTKNTVLGYNVNFNGISIRGSGSVEIGNNFHSGTDCLMITDNHNYDSGISIPYDSSLIAKKIIIEDNVWLGDRVIILGGVTLGEGCIIQAGSVVTKSVPKYAIAGGHPAKVFKMRDVEHYERLKAEGRFH